MEGEHNLDDFYHNDALRYYFQGAMCEIRGILKKLIQPVVTRPRIKKGFTHHDIDNKEITFTYYLN